MSPELNYPHGAMRRRKREIIDHCEIESIIHSANIMYLALAERDMPFLVPLHYAFDGTCLYFHSAKAGSKIEMLQRNNVVCFAISEYRGVEESEYPCDFEARHRTVIGVGRAYFVDNDAEKIKALDLIVAQFTEKKFTYPKTKLDITMVVRIEIDSIKGKKHAY